MKKAKCICLIAMLSTFLLSCKKDVPKNDPITYGNSFVVKISSDKAMYSPGDVVQFSLNKSIPGNVKIRYRHLSQTLSETDLTNNNWTWTAPSTDFTGYVVDIYEMTEGEEKVHASIGVDVSSDWKKFPRYGFLTNFAEMSESQSSKVLDNLARHHINGIQYYDWLYKHHMPLAGTGTAPQASWKEISNKDVFLSTLRQYISGAKERNIRSMFYNLAFGALSDAAADGVQEQWYLFKDANRNTKDRHELPKPFFSSDIYVLDAGNTAWQNYLTAKNADVYAALDFDGYHVDALGDRGSLYNYSGQAVSQTQSFAPFLQAMKTAAPAKRLVMNAVNQWGQAGIASSPVDFLYSEVWGPNERFEDLAKIIRDNYAFSGSTKNTVLAAYVNYDKANNQGFFNTPAVLLADAVIFAFGGLHLELGEHMLGKEYFPNNNLKMDDELTTSLIRYYDFLVGYENLLRDGGSFNMPTITCTNGKMNLQNWPASTGTVAVQGKLVGNRQLIHLLNFSNAPNMQWRDNDGSQARPSLIDGAELNLIAQGTVKKIWMASPDINHGVAQNIEFVQNGTNVTFTLPALKYWDMIVVEY